MPERDQHENTSYDIQRHDQLDGTDELFRSADLLSRFADLMSDYARLLRRDAARVMERVADRAAIRDEEETVVIPRGQEER